MKSFKTQLIALSLLLSIAFCAGLVSAGNPATPSTGVFPTNNTPLPVHTQGAPSGQVKGSGIQGGLSVGTFLASGAAEFDGVVGIQGILYGANTGATNTLSFGSDTPRNEVRLSISGDTYATGGGLYARDLQNNLTKQLCATQAGVIVFCQP